LVDWRRVDTRVDRYSAVGAFLLGVIMRRVLTIPLTSEGPAEVAKLVDVLAAGHDLTFEAAHIATKPDGVVLVCLVVDMPDDLQDPGPA